MKLDEAMFSELLKQVLINLYQQTKLNLHSIILNWLLLHLKNLLNKIAELFKLPIVSCVNHWVVGTINCYMLRSFNFDQQYWWTPLPLNLNALMK